jgi:hypothetical protein
MPYGIVKRVKGFRVRNKETGKLYSRHDQTKAMALKQLAALQIHAPDRNSSSRDVELFISGCVAGFTRFRGAFPEFFAA